MTFASVVKSSRFHKWKTVFWATGGVTITAIWPDSVTWVVIMSLYANLESSFTSWLTAVELETKARDADPPA